jgi:hypothetical protein
MHLFSNTVNPACEIDFHDFLQAEASSIITKRYLYPRESERPGCDASQQQDRSRWRIGRDPSHTDRDQVGESLDHEHAKMKFADWDEDGNGSLSVKELCGAIKDLNVKCSNVEFKKKIHEI